MSAERVSRRSAIRTGGVATILATVLGSSVASAAPPAPTRSTPAPVVDLPATTPSEALAAYMARWRTVRAEAERRHAALYERLWQLLDDDGQALLMEYSDGHSDLRGLDWDRAWELFYAHFPGIAPAMRMVLADCVLEQDLASDGCGCHEVPDPMDFPLSTRKV